MLLLPLNATLDVYRGFNAAAPYPSGTPAGTVRGYLRHHVRNGRMGRNAPLRWTHVLYLPPDADVRSAFNAHLNAWQSSNADTLLLADYPIPGWCTAFVAVLVQRLDRRGRSECLRVCLDRLRPQSGPCSGSGVLLPCCPNALPTTLHATVQNVSGCPCLDGIVVPLTYSSATTSWSGGIAVCGGSQISMGFQCGISSCATAGLTGNFDGYNFTSATVDPGCSCSPPQMVFGNVVLNAASQCPSGVVKVTVTA